MVRAALPARLLLLAPRVNESVMARAESGNSVFCGEHRAAFSDRFHVMNMQGASAAAYEVRESAVSVSNARAEVPPGLCVVRNRHSWSLVKSVPSLADVITNVHLIFTQFGDEVLDDVGAPFLDICAQ